MCPEQGAEDTPREASSPVAGLPSPVKACCSNNGATLSQSEESLGFCRSQRSKLLQRFKQGRGPKLCCGACVSQQVV